MKKLFSNFENIPPLCFEKVLIDTSGEKPIWNAYLYVVKNFLVGNKISKSYLLSFFTKMIKQNRYDWIKLKNKLEPKEFFLGTDFCMNLFIFVNNNKQWMDQNEEFAEKIGQIARKYIEFKQFGKEIDNSLLDILTYSKYDREKLRFVVSRIGRGIQLSKIIADKKSDAVKTISALQPKVEITDDSASKDFSYFFFKGYYTDMKV